MLDVNSLWAPCMWYEPSRNKDHCLILTSLIIWFTGMNLTDGSETIDQLIQKLIKFVGQINQLIKVLIEFLVNEDSSPSTGHCYRIFTIFLYLVTWSFFNHVQEGVLLNVEARYFPILQREWIAEPLLDGLWLIPSLIPKSLLKIVLNLLVPEDATTLYNREYKLSRVAITICISTYNIPCY